MAPYRRHCSRSLSQFFESFETHQRSRAHWIGNHRRPLRLERSSIVLLFLLAIFGGFTAQEELNDLLYIASRHRRWANATDDLDISKIHRRGNRELVQ